MKSIGRILRAQGEKISVIQDDSTVASYALIQPVNRRWRTFLSGERVPTGVIDNNHYIMIASPELDLGDTGEVTVKSSDKSYYVRSRGYFKVKGKKFYVWAVLAARTEPLEDDYDSD